MLIYKFSLPKNFNQKFPPLSGICNAARNKGSFVMIQPYAKPKPSFHHNQVWFSKAIHFCSIANADLEKTEINFYPVRRERLQVPGHAPRQRYPLKEKVIILIILIILIISQRGMIITAGSSGA